VSTSNGTSALIINAFEAYKIVDTRSATYAQDVKALEAIKSRFGIKDWISDPCFLIQWKGIVCKSNTSPIRISEIDLSGKNLTGLVPNDIGRLTALVKVSLDDNHLIGPLPNFSSLIMLERLYLQNNYLTGTFPNWLCELKNLKELNIENNNFSGEIPAQFLNGSLKFSYCGNPYLPMHKGECILHHRKKNKLKIVIGITLSGFLIIALALIVAIVVYRNKVRRKEQGADNERSGLEMERSSFFSQDHSMVVVPNPSKSRVFSLKEMIAATQTFSHEIGRGGFGSVFLGKLPQGEDIAVKVLSQSSQQGVHEFLNEVDLLSRIHHRNLVSLLGYCNETREVMLIYDYMSGGSLRDHLYGPSAHLCKLNWRTRLKIALDAAQGLEYLHVGCTPNIIHRDIKTANILLDSDLNGKLADFGLSKMTTDGEATHVTTAIKGTAGYLDPEYFSTWMLTHKSDVYSFGVVLLEIICGRQPIDLKLPAEELNIIRWVTPYVLDIDNPCKITKIIDKRLGGAYDMISVTAVAKLAMRCVQPEPSSRPSVTEVATELREAIKHDDRASISISEEIGIESSDLLSDPVSLSVDSSGPGGMEWSDISTISQVGEMSSHCVE
jgi:serine/threonine protein kinase